MIQLTDRQNPDYSPRQIIRYYAVVAAAHNKNLNTLMQKRRGIAPRWIPILKHFQDFLNIDYRHQDLTDRYEDSRHIRYSLSLLSEAIEMTKEATQGGANQLSPNSNRLNYAQAQWLHEKAELQELANALNQMKKNLEQVQKATYNQHVQTACPAKTQ